MTHAVKVQLPFNRHQVYYYLDLVSVLNAGNNNPHLEIYPGADNEKEASQIIESVKLDKKMTLIGIAPGASYGSSKRWPLESFINLTKKLVENTDFVIFIFGGKSENALGNQIVEMTKNRIYNFAGSISILTAAVLMKKCRLLLTNDSGAMHLGVAAGTKVIALFGPTNPAETGPLGEEHIVIQKNAACAPCLYRDCPENHECMAAITIDEVYKIIEQVINKKNVVPNGK
ncbi:MAG: lipopolysaccharide heptosyltransferase II [Candidatus Schekmanbacteria bacterium RBG_13_48_7]|uniref:lipopolysaccharide heptosyltransferase II n=1 Tax=Candidatus Schekmanbacteria bacterium RBG_13_48_7 TaxID=1817878 RepID=A0A1F7RJS7_9BACT|nr:MAG: lipopolysaccharide heptosyltransferase II [Candidatus Schekmanbacteria bacterium RBG_13_48_7]